ncbi:MAG: hypothetical protein ABGX26_08155 [Nautiliaceae bacterium]
MAYDFEFGSSTAKGGFASEDKVVEKFNNWKNDKEAQVWLKILGCRLEDIKEVRAIGIPPQINKEFARSLGLENDEDLQFKKADLQVQITVILSNGVIKRENISVKKANKNANYNQVDKRKVDRYQKIWKFDDEIATILKLFTGEIEPVKHPDLLCKYCGMTAEELEDCRRIYLNYLKPKYLEKIIKFFSEKKFQILLDIIKGRGALAAEWLMVVRYDPDKNETKWVLTNINTALDCFQIGDVKLTKKRKASLQLSNGIVMQRKGGTPDPTSLQFKIKPLLIFGYMDKFK